MAKELTTEITAATPGTITSIIRCCSENRLDGFAGIIVLLRTRKSDSPGSQSCGVEWSESRDKELFAIALPVIS